MKTTPYALISLTNKNNLELLIGNLVANDYKLIATTSTAQAIRALGYECKLVSDVASYPEILNGRVKTLQPEIFGGILADLTVSEHVADLHKHHINPISLVVCNLYEFAENLAAEDAKFINSTRDAKAQQLRHKNIIEHIDIGGVALIRAAAKNYERVALLCDPNDYFEFIERLNNGTINYAYRQLLAGKGYIHTANYDSKIANYFMKENDEYEQLLISAPLLQELRYGENPYQDANAYANEEKLGYSMNTSTIIQGRELSYNNMVDVDAAYQAMMEFAVPCAIAIKHATPCGVGWGKTLHEAYQNCFMVDEKSIFGGIVILNRPVDEELAQQLVSIFLEIVIAPDFQKEALAVFETKKNLRVIKGLFCDDQKDYLQVKSIRGAYLVQTTADKVNELKQVSQRRVDLNTQAALGMLNKVVKHVKSNAIVIGQKDYVLGLCGGMVNRIAAAENALSNALTNPRYDAEQPLLLASDGFFPFTDIISLCVAHNIKYIIQPGGSINDEKLITACDENDIGMVVTGTRYFRH